MDLNYAPKVLNNFDYVSKCMETVGVNIDEDTMKRIFELAGNNVNIARYIISQSVLVNGLNPITLDYINTIFEEREDHYYNDVTRRWLRSQKQADLTSDPNVTVFEFAQFAHDNHIDTIEYWKHLLHK